MIGPLETVLPFGDSGTGRNGVEPAMTGTFRIVVNGEVVVHGMSYPACCAWLTQDAFVNGEWAQVCIEKEKEEED